MDKLPFMCVLLLSLCVLTLVTRIILPVEAAGTIYIRVDGTINGTNNILRDGYIYSFTGDIFDSIVIEKDNIVIDGAGFSLLGTGVGTGTQFDT